MASVFVEDSFDEVGVLAAVAFLSAARRMDRSARDQASEPGGVHRGQSGDSGRRLGVAYVLEGCVRGAGDRVRITALLIVATSG